jgi:hypothetical protein
MGIWRLPKKVAYVTRSHEVGMSQVYLYTVRSREGGFDASFSDNLCFSFDKEMTVVWWDVPQPRIATEIRAACSSIFCSLNSVKGCLRLLVDLGPPY